MYQRHMYPSISALRRSVTQDVAALPTCSTRAFHVSPLRLEDQSRSGAASSSTPAQPQRETRKTRSASAFNRIAGLQARRPLPARANLAGGAFPSGQHVQRPNRPRNPRPQSSTVSTEGNASAPTAEGRPLIRRTTGNTPPGGIMVRAPSNLRTKRDFPGQSRGPNLRGRQLRGAGKDRGTESTPRKRDKKAGGNSGATRPTDITTESTLSDGMVQHLLRLQRKEWDRVPYEPKYAQGSLAANELIHKGRELFAGESAPIKVWGNLEKRIGIVGMHNTASNLQVRRVPAARGTFRPRGGG